MHLLSWISRASVGLQKVFTTTQDDMILTTVTFTCLFAVSLCYPTSHSPTLEISTPAGAIAASEATVLEESEPMSMLQEVSNENSPEERKLEEISVTPDQAAESLSEATVEKSSGVAVRDFDVGSREPGPSSRHAGLDVSLQRPLSESVVASELENVVENMSPTEDTLEHATAVNASNEIVAYSEASTPEATTVYEIPSAVLRADVQETSTETQEMMPTENSSTMLVPLADDESVRSERPQFQIVPRTGVLQTITFVTELQQEVGLPRRKSFSISIFQKSPQKDPLEIGTVM